MTATPPVGPGGAHIPDKTATAGKTPGTASQEDAARFSKALDKPKDATPSSSTKPQSGSDSTMSDNPSALFRRRESAESSQGQQGGRGDSRGNDSRSRDVDKPKQRSDEPEPLATPGNAMLDSLQPTSTVEETATVERPSAPDTSLSDMVQQVADRILVGDSGDTGQPEVRIMLKNEVLDGTEIRISENAGAYEVTFVADNKDIENFLANRQEQISTALGERLDREIRVAVTDRDGTPNQSGDQRGRDGQQGQGQPDDGRSRNRRSVQDESAG